MRLDPLHHLSKARRQRTAERYLEMVRCSFAQVSASIAVTLLAIPRLVAGQHPGPYGTTIEVLDRWIDETDATLNFAGAERGNPMNPFDLRIIWCSERRENVCGGTCTVFTGAGDQCLRTMQSTACLAATRNVRFCADERCESPCNIYTECGVRMDSGFCVAPFTRSIQSEYQAIPYQLQILTICYQSAKS